MRVFILLAEHFDVPGLVLQAHATRESAVAEAIELTETMVGDSSYVEREAVTDSTWESIVGKLQDAHGAAHCYVEIAETELRGAPDILAELRKAESFISGFEDDEMQEGIPAMLASIRAAIAKASS